MKASFASPLLSLERQRRQGAREGGSSPYLLTVQSTQTATMTDRNRPEERERAPPVLQLHASSFLPLGSPGAEKKEKRESEPTNQVEKRPWGKVERDGGEKQPPLILRSLLPAVSAYTLRLYSIPRNILPRACAGSLPSCQSTVNFLHSSRGKGTKKSLLCPSSLQGGWRVEVTVPKMEHSFRKYGSTAISSLRWMSISAEEWKSFPKETEWHTIMRKK